MRITCFEDIDANDGIFRYKIVSSAIFLKNLKLCKQINLFQQNKLP